MNRTPSRPCSQLTAAGEPCRAWAIRGSDPPLCSAHAGRNVGAGAPLGNQNARTHGFYAAAFTAPEVARLLAGAGGTSLDAEIVCARIALHRILHHLTAVSPDRHPRDYIRFATLVLQGARTVSRLLRDNHALGGTPPGELAAILDRALEELTEEGHVELSGRAAFAGDPYR